MEPRMYTAALESQIALGQRTAAIPPEFIALGAAVSADGLTVEIALRNVGSEPLTDFDQWQVVIHYDNYQANYEVTPLAYTASTPQAGEWCTTAEAALQPEEEITIAARLASPIAAGTINLAVVMNNKGRSASTFFEH